MAHRVQKSNRVLSSILKIGIYSYLFKEISSYFGLYPFESYKQKDLKVFSIEEIKNEWKIDPELLPAPEVHIEPEVTHKKKGHFF